MMMNLAFKMMAFAQMSNRQHCDGPGVCERVVCVTPGPGQFSMEESWFSIEECWFPTEECWFYNITAQGQGCVVSFLTRENRLIYQALACIHSANRLIYQALACIHSANGCWEQLQCLNDEPDQIIIWPGYCSSFSYWWSLRSTMIRSTMINHSASYAS